MKLKYININGYGVLVDESAPIKEGDYMMFNETSDIVKCTKSDAITVWSKYSQYDKEGTLKVIFAEKELNLDVPVLPNWREWEVERLADKLKVDTTYRDYEHLVKRGIIIGLNHNKAKYTEEDLRKVFYTAIQLGINQHIASSNLSNLKFQNEESVLNELIQSLQKLPKYIVMESEVVMVNYEGRNFGDKESLNPNGERSFYYDKKLKLIANSEGKQEGVIKQIIW